jgi:hypothetical protein
VAGKQQVKAQKPWDQGLIIKIGKTMRRVRGSISARELSDKTADLGHRISPETIARLDTGHRGSALSVPELLVLAAALNMPPALLIFDGYPEDSVEYLPGRESTSHEAVSWLSGDGRLPATGRKVSPTNVGVELVAAAREYSTALHTAAKVASGPLDDEKLKQELADRAGQLGAKVVELARELKEEKR